MNKFKRLKITLATVLCLIGGNKVSNFKVNAETPKSAQVENKASGNSKNVMSKEQKNSFNVGYILTIIVGFILVGRFIKEGSKKVETKFLLK